TDLVTSCEYDARAHQMRTGMPDIERPSAGFQTVIPGCERRTLPKSTTPSDDRGQGLLGFYRPPTLREKLAALAAAPLRSNRPQRR
ncbi:MAG: hypothetical protein WBZ27_15245, partial [Pseudolabrys sp.]